MLMIPLRIFVLDWKSVQSVMRRSALVSDEVGQMICDLALP